MPMKDDLQQLVASVPGALGAILIDWEGEAVEHAACMDDYDLKVLAAYKGAILLNVREAVRRFSNDSLEELVIGTAESQTILRLVSDDYFLVFTFRKGGDYLGRALLETRRCALKLRDEVL